MHSLRLHLDWVLHLYHWYPSQVIDCKCQYELVNRNSSQMGSRKRWCPGKCRIPRSLTIREYYRPLFKVSKCFRPYEGPSLKTLDLNFYIYRQYTNLFIFRFVSQHCLRSTLYLFEKVHSWSKKCTPQGDDCHEFSGETKGTTPQSDKKRQFQTPFN